MVTTALTRDVLVAKKFVEVALVVVATVAVNPVKLPLVALKLEVKKFVEVEF